jgi:hypothetical protein
VDLSAVRAPTTAVYRCLETDARCAIQPRAGGPGMSLTGQVVNDDLVAYCAPGQVSAGDLLTRGAGGLSGLTAATPAGATELTTDAVVRLQEGLWVVVGEGPDAELCRAAGLEGTSLRLASSLRQTHPLGSHVGAVEVLEVVDVRDEAGRGHHTRATLRRLVH